MLMTHVGSLSYNIHVRFIGCSEQTLARRRVWPIAGGDLDSKCCWTGCCRVAIRVLPDEQRDGRKLCVRCARWCGVLCVGRLHASTEKRMA